MKKHFSFLLALTILLTAVLLAVPSYAEGLRPDTYAEDLAALAGEPVSDPMFTTALSADVNGDLVTVKLTVSGTKAEDKIIGFEIPVFYDAERLTPVTDELDGEALDCFPTLPGKTWENLTSPNVREKNGQHYVFVQCGTAKTEYYGEQSALVCRLHFILNKEYDAAGVWLGNKTTKCFVDDGDLTKHLGKNAYVLAEYVAPYADGIEEAVGTYSGTKPFLFETELSAVLYRDTLTATVTCKGMKESDKVIGFQIPLYYDYERLNPDLSDMDGEALNCLKQGMPGKNWENLTAATIDEKNGEPCVFLQCGTAKTDYCKNGEDLVFTVTFSVKAGYTEAGVWTNANTTKCFVDDGKMTLYPGVASYAVGAVKVQPDEKADLPSDAIAIDTAGYAGDASVSIMAGDGENVLELTGRGCGKGKNLSDAFNILVGADGKVAALDFELGEPCGFVCPEGGYLLSYSVGKAGYGVLDGLKVGSAITLYNVDLDGVRALNGHIELTDAGFSFVVQEYEQGDITGDGEVDSIDYFTLKKVILGTIFPTGDQIYRLDVNNDGETDARDYIFLKKLVLGTM